MVRTVTHEDLLKYELLKQPEDHHRRFTRAADYELREFLFRSLTGQREHYLPLLFPNGVPGPAEKWSLQQAQGAVDGAEYTAAAKGTACGHIFKNGESTYHCKTCAADDTCVLCAKCFESSDHDGHMVFISVSPGNSGCCDCGDAEAWKKNVPCTIHSADAVPEQSPDMRYTGKEKMPVNGDLPQELVDTIRMTIARAVDYICDVFSCSPEQLRNPKTLESVRRDEKTARLSSTYGEEPEEPDGIEYCVVLWNDEKHTVHDVETQVARACKQTKKFGYAKAMEVNDIGRSVIKYSTDLEDLLKVAEIIEQLKVTVTVRSARDTFREQMCETIIDWIADISGCSVGNDAHILRNVVCEELLSSWRTGSSASNKDVGLQGLDDHEMDDNEKLRKSQRDTLGLIMAQGFPNIIIRRQGDGDDEENEDDSDEDDMAMGEDDMELDFDDFRQAADTAIAASAGEADMDVDFLDDNDDMTEVMEATMAGYPPPPRPENARRRHRVLTPADSDDGEGEQSIRPLTNEPYPNVPPTPKPKNTRGRQTRPSKHWMEKPEGFKSQRPSEPCEDLWQRVRLDYMILFDLRLWKILRINLRHLYITTVVTIPHFKRILGLRFAGLYTSLAQLYLIADREPDHSIINLSVQMLTTPTITQEVVERGNFLTNLMAILYTFLTTRQVGFAEDVSPRATLAFDAGAVTNRRMFHFFLDLRWLFQSEFIQHRFRVEPRYLVQFLDLVKLHQGICPNVRATGEHVEYESDAWISASMIIKEINKLCKQAAISFEPKPEDVGVNVHLQRAIRTVAQVTMINAFGLERKRFHASELKGDLSWHTVGPFDASGKKYSVPYHVVQSYPMSFHHPLHYLLSWLVEGAKDMAPEEMRSLLHFSTDDLRDPWNASRSPPPSQAFTSDELLCSLFDHPLRVCVWLAQMKAGMWVRNGITLRHQAHTYRSVSHRDVGYQRDILLIQAGLVLCSSENDKPGERFLAQMIDRFQMNSWFQGQYHTVGGFEDHQQLDVIEDFFHLLVIALCERGNLVPSAKGKEQHDKVLQHDIAHALCFKPLSFSDLASRVTEKVGDSDDFNTVLESMTIFRAPEGLNDSGTFELKPEFIELVDPYYAHYSRNHREEAENIYKKHVARKLGKKAEDVVYEPRLQAIPSGLFANLSGFTSSVLFVQVVLTGLQYAISARQRESKIQPTRIETFLHMVLHLVMIAVLEDGGQGAEGFVELAATSHNVAGSGLPHATIISGLVTLTGMEDYASCHPTIKHILRKMQLRQSENVRTAIGPLGAMLDRADTGSPASMSGDDKEKKKAEALARQARVMARMKEQQNSFLQNQGLSAFGEDIDDDFDDMSVTEEPESLDQRKTWSFPTGTCIWCQEETDDQRLYGTFAYLGESNILRTTPVDDPDFVNEVVAIPESLDRPADELRPFGVAGQNKQIISKVGADGKVTETERIGLSKGFPHAHQNNKQPVSTTCGHVMHYSCFDLYMTNSNNRHRQQIARNHPEAMELKEFCCPLCKALGNTFLPIIWKAKECTQEHELHAAKDFGDWLLDAAQVYRPNLWFLDAAESHAHAFQPEKQAVIQERAKEYVNNMFPASIVADMNSLTIENSVIRTAPETDSRRYPLRSGISLGRLFGTPRARPLSQSSIDTATTLSPTDGARRMRASELLLAYQRLDVTVMANALDSAVRLPHPNYRGDETNPDSSSLHVLSRALGMSISAFEIAHRGVGSDVQATSLLAEVSEQNMTHFRILSETIESYLAVNVTKGPSRDIATCLAKTREVMKTQLFELPLGNSFLVEECAAYSRKVLYTHDTFLFFTDWLSMMAPTVAEASNILRLCLWAEISKVVTMYEPPHSEPDAGSWTGGPVSKGFAEAVERIAQKDNEIHYGVREFHKTPAQFSLLRHLVDKYALTFLRKSIILMSVRYGHDFECTYNLDRSTAEISRLTALLHLPTIDDLCALYSSDTPSGAKLRELTDNWAYYASERVDGIREGLGPIKLSHPAIFELIGLPKNYDTLTEEAIKRRCPTTGKEITDPALCLFCGDIFCSQAVCCMKDKRHGGRGGCAQHMATCGGKVGIFVNVRKCMVLFLHGQGLANGSFMHAPYLDRHGETDPTLRRHHQLFLNRRRYDRGVREVWLGLGVPSLISRKLEGDINPGGWETL